MNKAHEPYKLLFAYDDLVQFETRMNGETKTITGVIRNTHQFGTFIHRNEPSYDIYSEEYDVVFKHIKQSELRKVTTESF